MANSELREKIVGLLMGTNRPGMDQLIKAMDEGGFFTSPCSAQFHLAKDEGLAEHSVNVFNVAMTTAFGVDPKMANDSVIIVCLLHDLGKMGQFGKPGYSENILKGGNRSDKKPFAVNKDLLPVDHEIRSIQIASQYIELTEEESFAILYHNGMYGNLKYTLKDNETPLMLLLHFADMWCSRVIEKEEKPNE